MTFKKHIKHDCSHCNLNTDFTWADTRVFRSKTNNFLCRVVFYRCMECSNLIENADIADNRNFNTPNMDDFTSSTGVPWIPETTAKSEEPEKLLDPDRFWKATQAASGASNGSALVLPVELKEVATDEIDDWESNTITPTLLDYETGTFITTYGITAGYTRIGDIVTVHLYGKVYAGHIDVIKEYQFKGLPYSSKED